VVTAAGGAASRPSTLTLRAVDAGSDGALPPGGRLLTASGRTIISTNPCRAVLLPHETLLHVPSPVFLAENAAAPAAARAAFSYALFAAGAPDVDLLDDGDKLVRNERFWTRGRPEDGLFGLKGGALPPGTYTLVARTGRGRVASAGSAGSAWHFSVAQPPVLTLSRLPIRNGTATETLFHAAAASQPAGFLFYFALRQDGGGDPLQTPVTPEACLGGCTGARAVSFLVPDAGRYYVQVDMVSDAGAVLASKVSDDAVVVSPAAQAPPAHKRTCWSPCARRGRRTTRPPFCWPSRRSAATRQASSAWTRTLPPGRRAA
jgi:hypothetical protein